MTASFPPGLVILSRARIGFDNFPKRRYSPVPTLVSVVQCSAHETSSLGQVGTDMDVWPACHVPARNGIHWPGSSPPTIRSLGVPAYYESVTPERVRPIPWLAHGGANLLAQQESTRPTNQPRTVLIIDQSEDSRQVLKTALERRGFQIVETRTAGDGLELVRIHHPELVVLDLETIPTDDPSIRVELDLETETSQTPIVILGNICKNEALLPHCSIVLKPYHYGPLIRKIEKIVASN